MPEIFIGSDHRGFELKEHLVTALSGGTDFESQIPAKTKDGEDYLVTDLGPFALDPDDDYNDAAIKVARAVREHEGAKGILICGSAHGIAMQANRFKGVRAIAAYSPELAKIGREHNDANVLCLSADFTSDKKTEAGKPLVDEIVRTFLDTDFSGEERHKRRNNRLDEEGAE